MAHTFSDDDNDDLIERGFEVEQIHYLESLEMDPEELYSDICKIMDDFGDTPQQIIESYQDAQNNPVDDEEERPSQGGKRRKQNKTRRRKQNKTRRRKQRKTRRRNQSKSKRRK